MSYADRTLVCRDCGGEFVFTAGEQEFFASRGLMNEPKRCPTCRSQRKQERYGGGPRQMTQVICSECGQPADVPFVPRGDRPVYCSSCFEKRRAGSSTYR
jgi:CxxC-x17-CxxC domain-containing protein